MLRTAVVVPGSSKWWLLTLSPIIYFDRVRVSAHDLSEIHAQADESSYHHAVSHVLRAIEHQADEEILVRDHSLPPRGTSPAIDDEVARLSDALLREADDFTAWRPTTVSPGQIKHALIHACREWRRYNRRKAYLLSSSDPLRAELLGRQIPASKEREVTYRSVPARRFPDFLRQDPKYLTIFKNIIRNAWLLSNAPNEPSERAYDVLATEFLPAVTILERYRVFVDLPQKEPRCHNFQMLVKLYDLRMRRLADAASRRLPTADEVVQTAFSERKRFGSLRKRLAEIDLLARERVLPEDRLVRELIELARDLHKQVQRIDAIGKYCIWASGAYVLREVLSTADPVVSRVVSSILLNPFTTERAREAVKNLYLAAQGVRGRAATAISVVRDYLGSASLDWEAPRIFGPGVYRFWTS